MSEPKVVDLTEKMPHFVIRSPGRAHVVPLSLVRKWISGEQPLPKDEGLLRAIIGEWFSIVTDGRSRR